MKQSFDDTYRLLTMPEIIVIRHILVQVILENVVTFFLGHSVDFGNRKYCSNGYDKHDNEICFS